MRAIRAAPTSEKLTDFLQFRRVKCLVNIANAWVDRQNLLDPIYLMLRSWGYGDDIQLRYRNTILTTLDTGAGTKKTLS